jgi:hypothetical protein
MIENNIDNRKKLAEAIVDACDMDALLDYFFESQHSYLQDVDNEEFNKLWSLYFDKE